MGEYIAALEAAGMVIVTHNPCLEKLSPGEPFFVLLGRDEDAAGAVRYWADSRAIRRGPSGKTASARLLADEMDRHRAALSQAADGGEVDASTGKGA